MDIPWLIHLPVGGHLDGFQLLTTTNKAVVNICIPMANIQYLHNEEIMKLVMCVSCVQVFRCYDDYLSKSYSNLSVFRLF